MWICCWQVEDGMEVGIQMLINVGKAVFSIAVSKSLTEVKSLIYSTQITRCLQ